MNKDCIIYFLFLNIRIDGVSLTETDFNVNLSLNPQTTGFESGDNKYGKDIISEQYSNEIGILPHKTEEYLYKFINLSKENGFDLILINAPYDYNSNDTEQLVH